jgi:GNAT superfamily N-acetyltransferase
MVPTTDPQNPAISLGQGDSFILRNFRPGDLGYIVHRHGVLYQEDFKGHLFEALVARIVADFVETYDPESECCWVAQRNDNGEFLGSVMLVKDRERTDSSRTARLRLLLVEPQSRGLGLGATLVRQCTKFAREAGYSRIVLWTQSNLLSARRLYRREGYRLVTSEDHAKFGTTVTGEHWELAL